MECNFRLFLQVHLHLSIDLEPETDLYCARVLGMREFGPKLYM
jgi:hypothetical protein